MAKSNSDESSKSKARPVHVVRFGAVKAAIWRNDTSVGPMYNVTVIRSYKDEEGDWQDSHSFGYDDLLPLAKALNVAHTWIHEAKRAASKSREDEEE